ncbi:MAG: flagellar filament capping protein FliD [Acidimicrobiales bacterium]
MSSTSSGTSVSGGSLTTPPIVSYGLVSGINTQQVIAAELQPFQIPINNLTSEQSTISSNVSDYQQINSDLLAMQTAANTLALPSGWNSRSATSSDTAVATATAAAGTPVGSVQFAVTQLASANTIVSSGSVSSTSQVVTSNPGLLISEGANQLGFASLAAGSGVALGSHSFSVTQASQAASLTGTTTPGAAGSTTTITSSNNTLDVTVNGTAYALSLAASPSGGYSSSALLAALNSAISSAGASGVLQAGYDSAGQLVLSTVDQGSSQSLAVTGGTALGTLGLSAASTTGVDAIVNVDGTANTISTVTPGAALSLSGPSGATYTATLEGSGSQAYVNSSLISVASINATDVSTGSGSLADVVANINAAGTGVTASAVQTSAGSYVLQMSSSQTGTNGDLSVDPNAFSSSTLGSLRTAVAGANAELQVGGTSGYTVSSQTNTFSGLLPGLSVTAQQVSSTPVTITVGNDASAAASSVGNLVSDANTVLSDLQKYAGYNEATKQGGPLMGSAILQGLTNSILSAVASTVGTSGVGSAANVGITISNGQLSFNQTTFEAAFNANPAQVQSVFAQGATFSPSSPSYSGQVSFSYASATTQPGSYAIDVSHSATQASDLGATLSGGSVTAAETLTIGAGSASATYTTTSGQSLTSIAAGLNSAFAAQGMSLSAQVVGGTQLQLVSAGYGSATSFSVSTTNTASGTLGLTGAASSATFSGTDVTGTINGVTATGSGQFLSAPTSDPTLAGLTVQVTASGITSSTNLGSLTYTPGLAQALATVANSMANPVTGAITQTVQSMQNQSAALTPQIQMYQNIVSQEQQMLANKYANMEATLGTLKNQSSALAGELASIAANG